MINEPDPLRVSEDAATEPGDPPRPRERPQVGHWLFGDDFVTGLPTGQQVLLGYWLLTGKDKLGGRTPNAPVLGKLAAASLFAAFMSNYHVARVIGRLILTSMLIGVAGGLATACLLAWLM